MAAVQENTVQTVRATAKFVRVSARKARIVADNIRGRSVPEARTVLAFTERAAAVDVEKVLRSAVSNAESNPALHWNGDDLVVHAVYVDEGPTLKRWRARARGRVARIHKRTCHITIELAPVGGGSLPEARNVPVPPAPAQEPIPVGPEPGEPQVDTPEAEAEVAAEAPVEEKPKRRSRAKKTEETSAEAAPAEEKPKRTRKKKTEETEG